MVLKIFRVVWFLSVAALFATLLYNYAGWGEELVIQEESTGNILIGREVFFYIMVGVFALVNALVYVISKLFPADEYFRAWFHGLIITINIFFIISMNLIGLYNSTEVFDYSRIGFIIYGSVGLVLVWASTWPVYALIQKFSIKQSV